METDKKKWEELTEDYGVCGHLCEGLLHFQRTSGYRDPYIEKDGTIHGDCYPNPVPIIYCPFCGVKIREI